MKRSPWIAAGGVGSIVAALSWSSPSFAQDTTVVAQPAAPATVTPAPETAVGYSGPNRALVGTGLVTFAASYIPAVIVAGESPQPADHHLYVPIAGPWLDMANRPACGAASVSCDSETTSKILLAVDGVFQGIGVLTTVAGFLAPEHEQTVTTLSTVGKPTIHIAPAEMGAGGAGVAAFGTW
jgi:hypothetical protein